MATKKEAEFDIRSAEPVVFFVGPGIVPDAPAADLSANALARLAWVRAGSKRPASPDHVSQEAIAAIRDELTATGKYSTERNP